MLPNFPIIALCALIPFFIAYIWFHPRVFGGETWASLANLTKEQNDKKIKPLQLLMSVVLNLLLSMGIFIVTVHQTHVLALTGPDVAAFESGPALEFMKMYGENFHTWQHGISHGLVIGLLFFVVPILGYAVIFERKSFKYLLVNAGYWGISLTLMATIISKWGGIPVW